MGRRREDGCRTGKKKCARVRGIRLPALQGMCARAHQFQRGGSNSVSTLPGLPGHQIRSDWRSIALFRASSAGDDSGGERLALLRGRRQALLGALRARRSSVVATSSDGSDCQAMRGGAGWQEGAVGLAVSCSRLLAGGRRSPFASVAGNWGPDTPSRLRRLEGMGARHR
jgi:hypothetical protein